MGIGVWAIALAVASGVPSFAVSVESLPTGPADFAGRAEDAEVVVLGEVHDNPIHHQNQAKIVAALQPDALVFEMIPQEFEDEVNELREEGAGRAQIAAALDWENSGWPDFAYYADILEAAPAARVFGAGQPLADVRRAMVEGATGPFGPDAAIYGLDVPLDSEEQAAREAVQEEAHCGTLPTEMLPGMVEAQRFRDAGLADAALWARTMTGGGQVVVITGNSHADKGRGMPAAIAIAAPEVEVLTLGQLEDDPGEPQTDTGTGYGAASRAAEPAADAPADAVAEAYDFYIVSPAPERGDPCDALREPPQ